MKPRVSMYLAGTIKKAHEKDDETYWTDVDMDLLREELSGYTVSFLNPAFRTDDMADQHSVFGRDMVQVSSADLVFVDARDRRGLGVGAEMMWAKVHGIPVVTWAPRDTHYFKTNTNTLGIDLQDWIHPFVYSLSDAIVDNLVDGARWIREEMLTGEAAIKGRSHIINAMEYYRTTQFPKDVPMQEMFGSDPELSMRAYQRIT